MAADLEVPMINGQAWDWASIKWMMFGKLVEEITAINYGKKFDKKNNYGRGRLPKSRGRGNVEFEGSITLSLKEVQAILSVLPAGKGLSDIAPFDVECAMQNDTDKMITDRLLYVEFTDDMRKFQQGESQLMVECGLIIGDIQFNV